MHDDFSGFPDTVVDIVRVVRYLGIVGGILTAESS